VIVGGKSNRNYGKKGVIVGGHRNEVEEHYGSIFGGHENFAGEYVTILGDWCGKVSCKGKCKDKNLMMDVKSARNMTIIDDDKNALGDSHFQCIKNKKKPDLKDICEFYPMMYTLTGTHTKTSTKVSSNDIDMD